MDLMTNSTVQTQPEPGSETPTRIHPPAPPPPLTNGVLKRHAPLSLHPPLVVSYKECLRNHAATIGGHAVDGCGEFMPSPSSNPSDPTGLRCAACGCHRNFHRREPEETTPPHTLPLPLPLPAPLEYRPNHRHHPPPPHGGAGDSGNNSPSSPPPISSSYYPAAPHVLLALGHAPDGNPQINYHSGGGGNPNSTPPPPLSASNGSRKRFRTKFTQNQKDKMQEFAERVGWRIQKRDEDLINEFCAEIGVDRTVFKVWMHNNKNPSGKKDPLSTTSPPPPPPPLPTINGNGMSYSAAVEEHFRVGPDEGDSCHDHHHHHVMGTNGSSSSC